MSTSKNLALTVRAHGYAMLTFTSDEPAMDAHDMSDEQWAEALALAKWLVVQAHTIRGTTARMAALIKVAHWCPAAYAEAVRWYASGGHRYKVFTLTTEEAT